MAKSPAKNHTACHITMERLVLPVPVILVPVTDRIINRLKQLIIKGTIHKRRYDWFLLPCASSM